MAQVSPASALNLDDKVIFDIDPFKESLEHMSSPTTNHKKNDGEANDNMTVTEISLDSDAEDTTSSSTTSSISYRALPTSASLERTTSSNSSSSSDSSISFTQDIKTMEEEEKKENKKQQVFLPAMETVIRNLGIIQQRSAAASTKAKHTAATATTTIKQQQINDHVNYSVEPAIVDDADLYSNSMVNQKINMKDVPVNNLGPREQEEAGM